METSNNYNTVLEGWPVTLPGYSPHLSILALELNCYFFISGQENFSFWLLQFACGASCVGNYECVLVLEDCQGFIKNSFKSKTQALSMQFSCCEYLLVS